MKNFFKNCNLKKKITHAIANHYYIVLITYTSFFGYMFYLTAQFLKYLIDIYYKKK